jgi:hypothetical protein
MTIFDAASVHSAVVSALQDADVPPDHRNALTVVATPDGVKAVLSTKVGDHWQVDGVVGVSSDKHVDGGVQVKATW